MGSNASSMPSRALAVVGVMMVMLLMRNVASKDYKTETKSYLRSIGKEDAIDKVVPKTAQV
jgi:hypothetical protein